MGTRKGKLAQAVVPRVAASGGLHVSLLHPTRRTHAPTRVAVAFRTAHPHSGPISRTKLRCAFDAPIISNGLFWTFSDPKNLGGGWPLAGLCSSAVRFGWAGQEGGGRQEGGRRGGKEGPFLSTLDVFAAKCLGSCAHAPCAPQRRPLVHQQWHPVARSADGPARPDGSKAAWRSGCTHDGVRCAASLQRGTLPFRRRRALCLLRSMYFEGSALPTR